jgi:hypothetical protein
MSRIAVRAYTQKQTQLVNRKPYAFKDPPLTHNRILVFDTETTTDQYQNLTFGSFKIYHRGYLQHQGLFYAPFMLNNTELITLKTYSKNHKIPLYTLEEFIEDVFYPEIYRKKTLCVGFNLAFDLSRLASKAANSRKNNRGGFTFFTSKDLANPPVKIMQIGHVNTFRFTTTMQNCGENYFAGYFLDVQTHAEVLLQGKHLSLEKVGELLNLPIKKKKISIHGRVTSEYIDYNVRDVDATQEAYNRLVGELKIYDITIPPTKVFSSASLGKQALTQLGIKPLSECQPDFPPHILGNIMTTYFGGRTECRVRKVPTKVSVLDFTSMYPTISMLLGIWELIRANGVEIETVTQEIRNLVSSVDLNTLQNQDLWKNLIVLVQVKPDNDALPIRMDYKGDKTSFNVGINYVTSNESLWYALPDVIASKLLTGKSPKIINAIRFKPKGKQPELKTSRVLGIPIDPTNDNLIQLLVEERQRIKKILKALSPDNPEFSILSSREKAMKILVNAMSYGIFIELNPEDRKREIDVFGVDEFITKKNHYERPGNFYHPLLAVMITSGSRLFLAMAEAKLLECGARHVYMDTDSIFVPPEYAQRIIDYFQPLNPYGVDIPLLKVEHEDVWFYGISSKRYALHQSEKGNISFLEGERSFKLHGLGHLTNPFPKSQGDWQAEIWRDILLLDKGLVSHLDIEEKYSRFYAIARMTVSTSNILNRFIVLNEGKEWRDQIKPFNFFLLGFHVKTDGKKLVKPLSPYSIDPQSIVHEPFIDYETGTIKHGLEYFKPLSKTILQYIDHPESKYEGGIGQLEQWHIEVTDIVHIGKESNNIEYEPLDGGNVEVFRNEVKERQRIVEMRQCDAERMGIDRKTRWRMKRKNL